MGHSNTSQARQQSWLAAILCCGATADPDEPQLGVAPAPSNVCDKQPSLRPPIPSWSSVSTWGPQTLDVPLLDAKHRVVTISESPAFQRSNDGAKLSGPPPLPAASSLRVQSMNALSRAPSYPRPYQDFNHTGVRRQSLVPLRLGPVVLRDLPSIDTNDLSHFDRTLRLVNRRSDSWGSSLSRENSVKTWAREDEAAAVNDDKSPSSIRSSTAPLQRGASKASTPSLTSRRSSERSRRLQKRSVAERCRVETDRVDQEILELNTIVREHKAEAARMRAANQHVAAVAPSMHITARPETLDDIGSALSKPLATQSRSDPAGSDRIRLRRGLEAQYSIPTDSWSSSAAADWFCTFLRSPSPSATSSDVPCHELDAPGGQQRQRGEQGRSQSDVSMSICSSESSAVYSPDFSEQGQSVTENSRSSTLSSPITPQSSRRGFQGTRQREKEYLWLCDTSSNDGVGMAL